MSTPPVPAVTELTAPFWRAATEGRLVLLRCRSCRRWQHPPRPWCPHCWAVDLDWDQVSGRGTILTFSVVHQAPSPGFTVPYVLAVVRLEEGPQLLTNVVECDPAQVTIGLAVEVVFEPRGELAVVHFRLAVPQNGDTG